ncbi:uncharacterized protein EDB91DRAFT_1085193 [Suillus paluster]|uniref:uncharacterized protein n=1 Tax=Suillus paluster TaxID=48578 RepID=UPI001B883EAD|nr:uncharacterized protein EDB91DRAFT_1085193 [Suillus paluster]KAG1731073.1 hypothetical protein EDB91DRAFT_1085193 [Suillus paluster]
MTSTDTFRLETYGSSWSNSVMKQTGCIAGDVWMNVTATMLCCNELGGEMLSANGSYGCAYVQNTFPATTQSVKAWANCSSTGFMCELPSTYSNYTGRPSGNTTTTSGGVGIGGSLMIGLLLFGVMAQVALTTLSRRLRTKCKDGLGMFAPAKKFACLKTPRVSPSPKATLGAKNLRVPCLLPTEMGTCGQGLSVTAYVIDFMDYVQAQQRCTEDEVVLPRSELKRIEVKIRYTLVHFDVDEPYDIIQETSASSTDDDTLAHRSVHVSLLEENSEDTFKTDR